MSPIIKSQSWETFKKFFPYIVFILLIVMSVLFFSTWSSLRQERKDRKFETEMYNQNFNAMKDSISMEFDKKLKAFIFEKDNYLVNELKDLKQFNSDLEKKLEKVKGDVIAAIDTKVTGKITDLSTTNDLVTVDINKGLYGLKFDSEYKDTGFENSIQGTSRFYANRDLEKNKWILKPDSTIFDNIESKINITYGFRELEDKYEVFAISPSPKITINQMDGVLVLDKCPKKPVPPKKWGLSAYIGPGLNTEFNGTNARFGWSIGVGLTYDFLQWRMPWEKKN
jgi:hypothetical protein